VGVKDRKPSGRDPVPVREAFVIGPPWAPEGFFLGPIVNCSRVGSSIGEISFNTIAIRQSSRVFTAMQSVHMRMNSCLSPPPKNPGSAYGNGKSRCQQYKFQKSLHYSTSLLRHIGTYCASTHAYILTLYPGLPGWPFGAKFQNLAPNNTCWPKNFCFALWLLFGSFPGKLAPCKN